jgi:hypothetical protein
MDLAAEQTPAFHGRHPMLFVFDEVGRRVPMAPGNVHDDAFLFVPGAGVKVAIYLRHALVPPLLPLPAVWLPALTYRTSVTP